MSPTVTDKNDSIRCYFVFPHSELLLEPIGTSNVSSKFRHLHGGGAACHTPTVVTTVHHTVVVSHVSLNAGCVDPS